MTNAEFAETAADAAYGSPGSGDCQQIDRGMARRVLVKDQKIRLAHARTDNEDQCLRELRQRWGPEWWVWRSRDDSGMPASWCATYRARPGELGQTLVESTPEQLAAALKAAKAGPRPELEPVTDGVCF